MSEVRIEHLDHHGQGMAELLGDRGPLDTCLQFAFDMGQAACGDSAGSRDLSASFVVDERRAEWYVPTLLHHFAGAELLWWKKLCDDSAWLRS